MKAAQIDQALHQKFVTEGERLVFWHDPHGEFSEFTAGGLSGDNAQVKVVEVAKSGGLSAKLLIEREAPASQFLIYTTGELPPAELDWLLDIRRYSAEFHADIASIWLQELGLAHLSLRGHLKARAAFLGSQDRRKKLTKLVNAQDDEAALDLKMLAVLVNSQVASPFDVLRALCQSHLQDAGGFDLAVPPAVMATIEKMGLQDRFWELMHTEFAYSVEQPSVAGLLRGLFISDLIYNAGIDGTVGLDSIAHHQLPPAGQRNAVVFLTHWRDSTGYAASYDAAANAIAAEQTISDVLADQDLDAIKDVFTFWEAERQIVGRLKDLMLDTAQSPDVEAAMALATDRKAGHWLVGHGRDHPERRAIAAAYDAVVAAAQLFELRTETRQTMSFSAPGELLHAYQTNLHRFDRLYREFCAKARLAAAQGWDLLKTLAVEVENTYDQSFLQPMGLEWSRLLDAGFLAEWQHKDFPAQQNFYAKTIKRHLAESERKRAFVIISDALRYEAGQELAERLNGRFRMDAKLSAMLGVLPSYTGLGMASLLPHDTLAYNDKGDVLVDGQSTAGTAARNTQLAKVNGIACQAKDLRAMKTSDARDFTEGKRVVYIYHNVIDARGDSASTESETFQAVADCITELADLVHFCVNKLNAAKVWVTADHGFLFQQDAPSATDKSKLANKPAHAVKEKKRYVIGQNLGATPEAHHGTTLATAGAEGGMEFWVPRSANRFHFSGGARFVHGGAMPQEVLVPLVAVTQLRGDKAVKSKIENVGVQVLGNNHKITTPKFRFEVIQTEAVSERKRPLTLRAAVYEGTLAVTSVDTLVLDSSSDSMAERTKSIRVELRLGKFDKATPYRLVLRDAETDKEVHAIPVVIDRSFDDDF